MCKKNDCTRRASAAFLAVLTALFVLVSMTNAQTTAFTYQGRLSAGAGAASGSYDLGFALFDAAAGGNQIGVNNSYSGVTVTGGIFTVNLNFGSATFPGADRWLEIRVKRPADATYATLTPRQRLTGTPYAIRSLSSASADTATNANQLGGMTAGNYALTSDSRFTDPRSPTAGSGNYVQNQFSSSQPANFKISGFGTANIFDAQTQYNIGGNQILFASIDGRNNLFVGLSAGISISSGIANTFVGAGTGFKNSTGGNNSFFGKFAGSNSNGSGNSFFGDSAGNLNTTGNNNTIMGSNADVGSNSLTNATAIGANALVTQSNSLILGSINGVNGAPAYTNVGIGTTAPSATFTVSTTATNSGENTATFRAPNIGTNQSHIHFGTTGDWFIRSAANTGKVVLQDFTGGNVGIGTSAPKAKLQVRGGRVYITQPNGLMVTSPNGSCWLIVVLDTGVLDTVSLSLSLVDFLE